MVEKKSKSLSERDNSFPSGKDLERWFKTYGATPPNLFLSPGKKKPGVLADRSPLEQLHIPQKNFLFPKQNLAAEQHAIQQDEVTPVRKDSNLPTVQFT